MSLARGLDYYTGIIYEAVTEASAPPGFKAANAFATSDATPSTPATPATPAPKKEKKAKKPANGEEEEEETTCTLQPPLLLTLDAPITSVRVPRSGKQASKQQGSRLSPILPVRLSISVSCRPAAL